MNSKTATLIEKITSDRQLTAILLRAGYFYSELNRDRGVTSRALKQLGFTDTEMRSGKFLLRIHPEDLPVYHSLWKRVEEGWEEEFYCEYRLRDHQCEWHWVATHATIVERNENGRIEAIVGTDRSIQSRKQAEAYTQRKYEIAESLRQTTTVVASDLELKENFQFALRQLRDILVFQFAQIGALHWENERWEAEVLAEEVSDNQGALVAKPRLELLIPSIEESFSPVIHDDLGSDYPARSLLAVPLRARGTLVGAVLLWHQSPGFFRGTDLYPVVAFGESITVAINMKNSVSKTMANLELDGLTGFLSRRSFDQKLEHLWPDYLEHFLSNSVAMIDIDHFKQVNDTWGHAIGDEVIRRLCELLKTSFRKEDTLGRYGGEEFVAVLPNTNGQAAHSIMERIRIAAEHLDCCGFTDTVTISIGIATIEGKRDLHEVLEMADKALYRAKAKGRNRVELSVLEFSPIFDS